MQYVPFVQIVTTKTGTKPKEVKPAEDWKAAHELTLTACGVLYGSVMKSEGEGGLTVRVDSKVELKAGNHFVEMSARSGKNGTVYFTIERILTEEEVKKYAPRRVLKSN